MSRENSPYILGPLWLDKRKDGRASEIWQIASYNKQTRSLHYRSTDCRDLGEAIEVIKLVHASATIDDAEFEADAPAAIILLQYVNEHASKAISASGLCANMRIFTAFLLNDELGLGAMVSDLTPRVFERFRAWRMGCHSYELVWQGKTYRHKSNGVVGETVNKNLDDLRAALNHAVTMGRLKVAPKVPAIRREFRSPPRDLVLTYEQLGAMIGYATFDPPLLRWILLLLATGMRPEAALKLNASEQFRPDHDLLDLHASGAPRTKKRNPVVPVIPEFRPWLENSNGNFVMQAGSNVQSMKRRWRTMRRELGLPPDTVSKTIRHTVATQLRSLGATIDQIAALLGHQESNRITAVYAKYDPNYIGEVKDRLSIIWGRSMEAAEAWRIKHRRNMRTNSSGAVLLRDLQRDGPPTPFRDLAVDRPPWLCR